MGQGDGADGSRTRDNLAPKDRAKEAVSVRSMASQESEVPGKAILPIARGSIGSPPGGAVAGHTGQPVKSGYRLGVSDDRTEGRHRRHPRCHHRRGFLRSVRDAVGFCREDGGRPSSQGRGWLPHRSVGPGGTGEPLPPQASIPSPLLAEVRQAHEEALVAGATPEAIVPPGQARMVDTWADDAGQLG